MDSKRNPVDFPVVDYRAERKLVTGFIIALVILAGMVLYSHFSLQSLIRYRNETIAGHQFINHLNRILILMQDMESNERGFLISGDAQFRSNYNISESQIDPEFVQLMVLAQEDDRRRKMIEDLRAMVSAKQRIMEGYLASRSADAFFLE